MAVGMTRVKMKINNPEESGPGKTVELLVDSGAHYSVIDSRILKKIGIKPRQTEEFEMADSQTIRRQIGLARFDFKNRSGFADVVFGEPDDAQLLGVMTLESLGLGLNPIKRKLTPLKLRI